MKAKAILVLAAAALIFALGIGFSKAEQVQIEDFERTEIIRKLDQILLNQAEIFEQIEEIKQELDIIRVRASR